MPSILDRLRAFAKPTVIQVSLSSDAPTQVLNYTAKSLYQSQDNLKAVVDFLSNSIAQLPLKVYRRDAETERKRDRDSAPALLLWRPNEDQTAFEFIRALAEEYYVFGCVYVWVTPDAESPSGYQMRIIPSEWVKQTNGGSVYAPDSIVVATSAGVYVELPRSEYVCFKTYSPGNPGGYVSPMSALRQTLQEQIEAGRFRRELWRSSGRLNAQILRPKDVQPWDDQARKRFVETFRKSWGSGGDKAGSIPLLEDGMEIKPFQTSFKEQQWMESVKLSRESVAAAYSINPSLIWHTDTQTYASSKDNARALYAECLGPTLQMIQQRINSFLLPLVGGTSDMYVEFDLTEKLKGSFEERASILQAAVGAPYMTRNEARADNNLPPIEGGDELITPLNVYNGTDNPDIDLEALNPDDEYEQPKSIIPKRYKSNNLRIKGASQKAEDEAVEAVIRKFVKRQADSVLPKIGAKAASWWDAKRWDKELADDLEKIIDLIAKRHGKATADEIDGVYDIDRTKNYLRAKAEGRAKWYNQQTYKKLQQALDDYDPDDEDSKSPADVFAERAKGGDASRAAVVIAGQVASWATVEVAKQTHEAQPKKVIKKVWVAHPTQNSRSTHLLMDGEEADLDATFSNGARWPGDDSLEPEESCYCNCTTDVVITMEV
ncbi:MAG: phage portal protein [Clostridiales bacterium]|nr:phage portal protein [Clostridiales bacterium]